jgi:hypothetical protein
LRRTRTRTSSTLARGLPAGLRVVDRSRSPTIAAPSPLEARRGAPDNAGVIVSARTKPIALKAKSMRQTQQENLARMVTSNYDCQLPPEAMDELLLRPKRARILAPPPPPPPAPPDRAGWMRRHPRAAAALGLLVGIVALIGFANWLSETPDTGHQPKPATLQPAPTAMPAPAGPSEAPAPRAMLVPVPVKRAALWRLPGQELGVYKWYELPLAWGGGPVWARYMGTKEHFSQIPPGPIPGDLWNVTETGNSWIFCTPIGYGHAAWIDP